MIAAGVVYPVTDSALKHTSPIMIATLRALVGGLILTLALPLLRSRLPRTRRLWAWAFAIGFGNTTLTQVGISVGTARAGAAVASVLLNSSPFFVALIARFALREPITRVRAIGLVIGFGGVLLVVLADPGNIAHGSQLAIGFVLALLGALGWAGGGLGMRALTQREPDLDLSGHTAAQFLAGGIPLIPLAVARRRQHHLERPDLDRPTRLPDHRRAGARLPRLQRRASRWPSTRVYAWTFLVPVVAVLIEAAQGALPGPAATVGIIVVITGVAIVNHPRAEAPTAAELASPPAPGRAVSTRTATPGSAHDRHPKAHPRRRQRRAARRKHGGVAPGRRLEVAWSPAVRARLEVGDCDSAPGSLGGRFRASTITCCVSTGRTEGPLRPRSPGCRLARRSGHPVPAEARAHFRFDRIVCGNLANNAAGETSPLVAERPSRQRRFERYRKLVHLDNVAQGREDCCSGEEEQPETEAASSSFDLRALYPACFVSRSRRRVSGCYRGTGSPAWTCSLTSPWAASYSNSSA